MAKRKTTKTKQKKATSPVEDSFIRPETFSDFATVFGFAKKAIYSITRIRNINGSTEVVTMGTAFIASPGKLVTCAHVFDSVEVTSAQAPLAHHQDGDTYYLLNKDSLDKSHFYRFTGKIGKNIHLYPNIDTAVITVSDDFYQFNGKILQHKDVYLKLAKRPYDIGSEAGVLGFPAEADEAKKVSGIYIDKTTGDLVDDLVKKRADRGVVNARYVDSEDSITKYDFTMAFNPGNSGGPIIDKDCNVIAIVRGYRTFPIKLLQETFTVTAPNGTVNNLVVPSTLKALYSIGFSTENLTAVADEHQML